MKKIYFSAILLQCLFVLQAQTNIQRTLNPIEQKKIDLPPFERSEMTLRDGSNESIDYTKGVFILNEDWFGHNNSTINFMKEGSYEFVYRVYQRENPGKTFGCTSQYGTIFGDNLFVMSKQEKDPGDANIGGRLIIADAKTLKTKLTLQEIGGGDGRAFLGVNDSVGYVGSSAGIYVFDIKNMKLGNIIEGSNNSGGLYSGQIGLMVRTKTYVFAIRQSKGIFVIDPKTHKIIKTIPGSYSTLTQSKDGMVWIGAGKKLLRIDPETLDEEFINLPDELVIPDSWYAWTAGVLCASINENALYFTTGAGLFTGGKIWRYEIGNPSSLDKPLYDIPESGRKLYTGAGFRVGPDEKLYISVFEQFGSVNYWQYVIDAKTGAEIGKYKQELAYWFPAMHIFPDVAPPVVTDFTPVKVGINSDPVVISLKGMATDADNLDEAIYKSIKSVSDTSLISASIFGDKLTLTFTPEKKGDAIVTVNFDSNGKIVTKDLQVTIENSAFYLNKHSMTLAPNTTFQLTASGSDPVVWESKNTTVATVVNGLVTTNEKGETMIIATAGNLKDSCKITVETPLQSLSFRETEKTVQRDSSYQIEVIYEPSDAAVPELIWESENAIVAHVNKSGNVSALKDGKTVIKASTLDKSFSASCNITVRADIKSFSIQDKLVLNTNKKGKQNSFILKPKLIPAKPTNARIKWETSDPTVAIVERGRVTAKKAGKATITATTEEGGFMAKCEVTCILWYDKIILNKNTISLSPGGTDRLIATGEPDSITTPLIYTSDNPEVVAVDQQGNITAGNEYGKATIIVQPADSSEVFGICNVAVEVPVERITLDRDTIRQVAETTYQLTASVYPENATFKNIEWKSTKMSPVRVSQDGIVSFVRPGQSNVIATSEFGGVADTCVIIVVEKAAISVTSITLNQQTITLNLKDGIYDKLTATLEPANPTYPEIVWRSSDEAVAKIDKHTGIITPLKTGTTEISASVTDGLSQTCLVTVIKKIESISLNMNKAEIEIGKKLQLKARITPEDATEQSVQWTSSDESVVRVNQNGLVTGVKKGTAKIYVTAMENGMKDSCIITVKYIDVNRIVLNHDKIEIKEYDTFKLEATIEPDNATDKEITWSTSDESVATVSADGLVNAINPGKATITAAAKDKIATCEVTVKEYLILTTPPKIDVSGNTIKISFQQIDEATSYELTLFEYKGVEEIPVQKYELDQHGNIISDLKSGSDADNSTKTIVFVFKDLKPNTDYAVWFNAIKKEDGVKKVIYKIMTERTSTVGNIALDDALKPRVYYRKGNLHLDNMQGYKCSIIGMDGLITEIWQEKQEQATRPCKLNEGIYMLNAVKGNQRINIKFIVQ